MTPEQPRTLQLDLAVVVLNYNGGPLLQRVVDAARASRDLRLGVVVVDNGSSDGSLEALTQGQREQAAASTVPLVLLPTGENLGYAAGNNLGLFVLPARYIALLNNDALVEPDTLATLVRFMDGTPAAGACGPRLLWPDGRPQPFSHGGDPTPWYLLRRAVARRAGRDLHAWSGKRPRAVDWVAGTCMVLRASALDQVGLLDEGTFMYFEDNDLCRRLRRRGWAVYFVPGAAIRHFNQPSYGDRARVARYYAGLSRFYGRHYGPLAGLALRLLSAVRLRVLPSAASSARVGRSRRPG